MRVDLSLWERWVPALRSGMKNAAARPGHGKSPASPLRQLQFDAAVALVGFFGGRGVERLEFGEAGGDEALRWHAERDQILHHRDGARRGQFPVRLEQRAVGDR